MLDVAKFLDSLSALPLVRFQAGDLILHKGHSTGRLYILVQGAVEVMDGDHRIAFSNAPGAVFGELGVLLNQPHIADVRVLEPSTFYVAHGKVFLRVHPLAALHVATVLASRQMAVQEDLDRLRLRHGVGPEHRTLEQMMDAVGRSLHASVG